MRVGKNLNKTQMKTMKNEDFFWKLIDLLDWEKGTEKEIAQNLIESLAALGTEEIIAFDEVLCQKLYLLDTPAHAQEIGKYAFRTENGEIAFNEEHFLHVRCLAVAWGKEAYYSILSKPSEMPKEDYFERLLLVPGYAYRLKTNQTYTHICKHNYLTFSNKQAWKLEKTALELALA
jgi:Protein of unknown function (DUF4240)